MSEVSAMNMIIPKKNEEPPLETVRTKEKTQVNDVFLEFWKLLCHLKALFWFQTRAQVPEQISADQNCFRDFINFSADERLPVVSTSNLQNFTSRSIGIVAKKLANKQLVASLKARTREVEHRWKLLRC